MKGGEDIGDEGIRRAFAQSIGAPPLRDLAKGRRDAAILIDDLTRPTPSYRILPYVLKELAAGGLDDSQVRIVCAVASHRPMTRQDFVKKIGLDLVERLHVINHNAYGNLEFYGNSSEGIPIWINRDFARSDLKIAAGMITPRGSFFGGGAKLLIPGACGLQTILATHSHVPNDRFRQHIDEVAQIAGLHYIVNPLLNGQGGIMAMVAGDPEKAYWQGVRLGKDLYRTETPEDIDVAVCNAWPKDIEGTQAGMARVVLGGKGSQLLKDNGTIVITAACPEGFGFHSTTGPGTRWRERILSEVRDTAGVPHVRTILFSPNLNKYDIPAYFGKSTIFCKSWSEVLSILEQEHGLHAKVAVFPCGAMQYGGE